MSQTTDNDPPLWLISSTQRRSRRWVAGDKKDCSFEPDNQVSFTEHFWKPVAGVVVRDGAPGGKATLSERERAGWEEFLAASSKATCMALSMLGKPIPAELATASSNLKFPVQKGEKGCRVCGKVFQTSSTLSLHMKAHVLDYQFWCTRCKKGFTYKKSLADHLRFCGEEKQFVCLFRVQQDDGSKIACMKKFHKAGHLKQHTSEVHQQVFKDAIYCSYRRRGCDKKYTVVASKASHERDCTYNPAYRGPYLCPLAGCSGENARKKDIRQHLIKVHKMEPESTRLLRLLKQVQGKKDAAKAKRAKKD